jgi:hypothetical protein
VAVPAAILAGDDLLTISGYGYVGATNTYQEGARIRFISSGTVSDAANGFAKGIEFLTNTAGNASSASFSVQPDGTVKFHKNNTTGAGSAALGSNCPAVTVAAPYTWIQVTTSDGSTAYIPVWK